ncbi:unnamed protein product [Caenorhabditis auriculariae]|uniref:Uncharacterized protein n=1 Tax=Caenorhabditis auriculariae TaxID=2777116 RepID=A0A8S1HG44_9PELO|nr:unnamed protein product [Caenorhabditis auriculariae]
MGSLLSIEQLYCKAPFLAATQTFLSPTLSYLFSKTRKTNVMSKASTSFAKSCYKDAFPLVVYCTNHTIKQTDLQKELDEVTKERSPWPYMSGAPEVLTFGSNFIKMINAKRILDIGTYTGASAFAWALATPEDGEVYTLDVSFEIYECFGVPTISQAEEFKKIKPMKGPALKTLDTFISEGQAGTFDFAFIDADKPNYVNYYERVMVLLRSGGVIFVDNALWEGRVMDTAKYSDEATLGIDELNKKIFEDDRSLSALVNLADGLHIAFKI